MTLFDLIELHFEFFGIITTGACVLGGLWVASKLRE